MFMFAAYIKQWVTVTCSQCVSEDLNKDMNIVSLYNYIDLIVEEYYSRQLRNCFLLLFSNPSKVQSYTTYRNSIHLGQKQRHDAVSGWRGHKAWCPRRASSEKVFVDTLTGKRDPLQRCHLLFIPTIQRVMKSSK
ncbi:hypothetical protein RchiOBHm_Chr5g0075741 [Rosa chinensis]|uniref:Uncharacterized protein n=1 Tax=Rosa chinensis TaxID=74649 RepID=A0A2P6QLJ7_ROSCH|nr:hypothetical protein RchiOBHm_Chr5g0075741 [Rosa chinensis]